MQEARQNLIIHISNKSQLIQLAEELYNDLELKFEVEDLLNFFDTFSKAIIRDRELARMEGSVFLANWMRKSNLRKLLEKNLGNIGYLDQFLGDERKKMKAVPRGLICHWVAGNVPTLTFFSVIQSLLVNNLNIARISKQSLEHAEVLLKKFSECECNGLSGKDLMKKFRIVYFPSDRTDLHLQLSQLADGRVIWGGRESVDHIRQLSTMSHCEDIIFGPKYSFGVIDQTALNLPELGKYIGRFVEDAVFVEQTGCSSPHVIFVEGDLDVVIGHFKEAFSEISKRFPKNGVAQAIAAKIIMTRAEYAMEGKKVICTPELDWTLLAGDDQLELVEPVQGRTIFLKRIENIFELKKVMTREVQTIGLLTTDRERAEAFAAEMALHGAARIVLPGQMNIYDSPWDGILLINRLVRWITLTHL